MTCLAWTLTARKTVSCTDRGKIAKPSEVNMAKMNPPTKQSQSSTRDRANPPQRFTSMPAPPKPPKSPGGVKKIKTYEAV